MKIGIVGNGVVGNATALAFAGHEVLRYDYIRERCTHNLSDVVRCDVIFVCLPTPQKIGSSECDTSEIDHLWDTLGVDSCKRNFVLRSTVPIGYTKKVRDNWDLPNLVHSPEFLTARTAVYDAANPTRLVIGCPRVKDEMICQCCYALRSLYARRWPNVPIFNMSSDESEAVKLFQNSFSAVKISYFNEIRCLADKLGLDWNRCLSALLAGGWISHYHTSVPGPDGKRGYGGSCLPKDTANLADCLQKAGCEDWMVTAAINRNKEDRK